MSLLKGKICSLAMNNQFWRNYSRMWPFVRPYWIAALFAMIVCIPVGSLDAVIALFLKPYTDVVVVGKNMDSPWYIPLLIVGFTSLQGFLNYASTYLNTWVGGKLSKSLRDKIYEKLVDLEPAFFDSATSGEIMFRFNSDVDLACNGLLDNLKRLLTRIFSSIALVGVLFYNSWQLALMAIVIMTLAIAPLARLRNMLNSLISQNTKCVFQLNTLYNETFSGNRTIAAYTLEERQQKNAFGCSRTFLI